MGRGSVFALAVLTSACRSETVRIQRPTVGQPIADVVLLDLEGGEVALSELQGTPVLLNLWATWCPPCRAEIPYLQTLQDRYRDRGLRVVGVSVDAAQARTAVDAFLEESGVEYLQLLDPSSKSMDLYGVIGLPVSFLLDAERVVRFARLGPIVESDPQFERALMDVLGP